MHQSKSSSSLWPEMKGVRGKLTVLLMRISFFLRRHPARFLYRDSMLKAAGTLVPGEMEIFQKAWNGPIWDVGASVGKYTAVLAKANPTQTVFAFEPNLNSVYYLAYRTSRFANVVIVPLALTEEGGPMLGNHDPDFLSAPTGPRVVTISLEEALRKSGSPAFAKFDIEGGEYSVFKKFPEALRGASLLIEWHPYIGGQPPLEIPGYTARQIGPQTHTVTYFYEPQT